CNLHRDKARAYEHDPLGGGGPANNHTAIVKRAQVGNMRQVCTGNLQPDGFGTGSEEQRIKLAPTAIRKVDGLLPRIDGGAPRIEQQFDLALAIEVHRAQGDRFLRSGTGKKVLGEIWPVIRNSIIRADYRDFAGTSFSPQHFPRGITCSAASHDDDVL